MARILIVDDEPQIVRGLEDNLRFEGYQTSTARDGYEALSVAAREAPDLILLDIMMPDKSGWDVCRELRGQGIDVPIIMLTARGEETDRVRGLELTRKEFDLLVYLLEHRGEVVTRERLLEEVWGYERFPTTRTVDTHILRLRRKFERDPERPEFIVTHHGQGYKFTAA
jgi:DNA-binding response OmpR family regulator